MLKNFFKENAKNYWRNIDKTIFISFILLFVLGIFFSFASTSTLAGERLNKDYYFFFFKTSYFCNIRNFVNDFNFLNSLEFF
jgi:cell division protein FtsW (lipid II flippase)